MALMCYRLPSLAMFPPPSTVGDKHLVLQFNPHRTGSFYSFLSSPDISFADFCSPGNLVPQHKGK